MRSGEAALRSTRYCHRGQGCLRAEWRDSRGFPSNVPSQVEALALAGNQHFDAARTALCAGLFVESVHEVVSVLGIVVRKDERGAVLQLPNQVEGLGGGRMAP